MTNVGYFLFALAAAGLAIEQWVTLRQTFCPVQTPVGISLGKIGQSVVEVKSNPPNAPPPSRSAAHHSLPTVFRDGHHRPAARRSVWVDGDGDGEA